MTNKEAIEILDQWRNIEVITETAAYLHIALNKAIKALEKERSEIIRCENCRHDSNCEIQYSAQAGSKFFCGLAERGEQ